MCCKIMLMKKAEILAPAGTREALEAAVKAGADAVYVGGNAFSARAFAGNFDTDELLKAIDHCHIYGTKIYLTVNTLLKEDEIGQLPGYIAPFYKAGLDAVLVQDMGVGALLAREFPDLPLHASTQISISSSYGAAFLKSLGYTRVVPARELSLEEIKSIKRNADIEIETFIHGAMCYAYSGKCMLSSFLGGRSGNRGRCAQPCRKCYEHEGRKAYFMCLKDMCSLESIPSLMEAGIDSFKIEGRMKKPEYVAGTVRAYRLAVDSYAAGSWDGTSIKAEIQNMQDIYNRGGFSKGYYFVQRGEEMLSKERPNHSGVRLGKVESVKPPYVNIRLGVDANPADVIEIREANVELTLANGRRAGETLAAAGNHFKRIKPGMEVYRTRNNRLLKEIQEDIIDKEETVEATAFVRAVTGKPLEISIYNRNAAATMQGNMVSKAATRATDEAAIKEKMAKTKGYGLRLDTECEISNDAFIPMSELNDLRRQAMENFKEALAAKYHRL